LAESMRPILTTDRHNLIRTEARVRQRPFDWSRWEYGVWHELYDRAEAGPDGIEQGYRLPHWSDHEWPQRDWNSDKILKECGPVIDARRVSGSSG
jgi:hypothetical protein